MITLLYYIHDLVKLKRLQSQVHFVAHQMASMLQNVSQNRTDKAITKNDIRHIASAAYLTIFPGITQFTATGKHDGYLGYNPMWYVICVKGNENSTASVVWVQRYFSCNDAINPETINQDSRIDRTITSNLQNVEPSRIHPNLKLEKNEIKIILECTIHYSQASSYSFADGRNCSTVSPSKAFGFFVYPLAPPKTQDGKNDAIYFHSVVIFSPRPGLFSETAPK